MCLYTHIFTHMYNVQCRYMYNTTSPPLSTYSLFSLPPSLLHEHVHVPLPLFPPGTNTWYDGCCLIQETRFLSLGADIPITVLPVTLSTIPMPFDPRTNSEGVVSTATPLLASLFRLSSAYFSMQASLQ